MREVPFADLDVDEIDIPAFLLPGPEDDEDAPEPAVVLPPPATMTEIPSFGLDGAGKALSLGGPSLLQTTVENLLGVPLPTALVASDAQITSYVQSAGALDVDVPTRVEQVDGAGDVNVLWD